MAICCQEPADAWILPQMQGETRLQDAPVKKIFLAVIKLLFLGLFPWVFSAAVLTHNIQSG